MKKKIIVSLFFTVLFGLVLAAQVSGQSKFGQRTEPFLKTFSSGTYHMKSTMSSDGNTAEMEVFAKGGMIASVMSALGETARTVVRDNKTYMIMDSMKMIIVAASTDISGTGAVDAGNLKFTGSGTAAFAGKNLPFEEYASNDGSKMLFFVDGNRLAGIRTSVPEQGSADMVISALDQNIPDSVFNIPTSGYQVQDMSSFGR